MAMKKKIADEPPVPGPGAMKKKIADEPQVPGPGPVNWRGKNKAAVQQARTDRQNQRIADRKKPPTAPPGAPPPGTTPPPPGAPPPTTPPLGEPSFTDFNPQYAGGSQMEQMLMQLLGGMPMGGMGAGVPQELPFGGFAGPGGIGGGGIDDPIQNYLSTVPVMDTMMRDRVSGAMGQAGLTGGRFSSGAQKTAAQIGADTSLQQNQMLNDMLYRHTQSDLDRGLQASMGALGFGAQDRDRQVGAAGQLGQLGLGQDQAEMARLGMLGDAAKYEQDRQDQFSMVRYQDFMQSRLGFLPMLMQLMGSATGSPGQPQGYPITTSQGQPGIIDFLPFLFGMFD